MAVFADLVVLLGLPKSMGEIYGFIFASAEPPTFADIEQKLNLSKGSVSQGLRALRDLGAVREADAAKEETGDLKPEVSDVSKVAASRSSPSAVPQVSGLSPQPPSTLSVSGSRLQAPRSSLPAASARASHWVATTELRQLIGSLLRERLTPYLSRQDQRMQSAESALDSEVSRLSAKDYKALKARLTKLQTWQSRARTVLPVLGKML